MFMGCMPRRKPVAAMLKGFEWASRSSHRMLQYHFCKQAETEMGRQFFSKVMSALFGIRRTITVSQSSITSVEGELEAEFKRFSKRL
jgi:hypothetical protein